MTPLIDEHGDLPYLTRPEQQNYVQDTDRFRFRDKFADNKDLPMMKAGRVAGQFWSVFVECPTIKKLDDVLHYYETSTCTQ